MRERPLWVGEAARTQARLGRACRRRRGVRDRIAAGEIFQANVCLRLDSRFEGNPADLFAHDAGARAAPRRLCRRPWGALCSLPELFLRRRSRKVLTGADQGDRATRRGCTGRTHPSRLATRAENVMIVDLMRNDLGRGASTAASACRS